MGQETGGGGPAEGRQEDMWMLGTIYLALSKLQIKRITSALRDTQATQNANGTGSTIITKKKKRAIGGANGGRQKLSDIPKLGKFEGYFEGLQDKRLP